MDPDDYDPYGQGGRMQPPVYAPQDGEQQVRENFVRKHSPWRGLAEYLIIALLGAQFAARHPRAGRIVSEVVAVALVLGFIYVLYRMHTSPENQPVRVNP